MRLNRFSPRAYLASIWRDTREALSRTLHDRAALAAIVLLGLPWGALIFLRDNWAWLELFAQMLGMVFVFWWMSRSGAQPLAPVSKPRAEFMLAMLLIVLWVMWRAGICTKAFFFLPADFACYKSWEIEILPKMFEQVIFPISVLMLAGYRLRDLGLHWSWRAWWICLPITIALIGYGLYRHADWTSYGKSFVEFFFAAGLPEEILFRVILLTRLEAWWRNPAWALFGASVIFGLTHLPINYLVFTNRDWREAWITLLTFQMGFGAVFAFAYQRTRNVLPLAIVHALIDAL